MKTNLVVLITGASKGVGYALTNDFLSNGHTVIALSRSIDSLTELKKRFPDNLKYFSEDISTISKETLIDISSQFEKIDIIINNAGLLLNKSILEVSKEEYQRIFDVNFYGPISIVQSFIDLLRKSSVAHVVNIGSMGGFQGSLKFPGLNVYSSSKAALACLTECLAEEFKDENITFNCLCLGAVQTEMLDNAFPDYKAPLSSEEMSNFIFDFSMNAYKYIKGKVLPISMSTP